MPRPENRAVLAEIEQLLQSYPGARAVRGETGLLVEGSQPGGFDISLTDGGEGLTLGLDGIVIETIGAEHIRQMIQSALDGELRIKVDRIGGRPWQWAIERRGADLAWTTEHVMGRLVFRFWGERTVAYFRNEFARTVPPGSARSQ